ncbi:unnamed protein product [Oikopleura dioica]|uniref:Uncharacterized protein n=1 Tax=Oikopleura dioica TaxID=34765 RepID=E4YG76_OIKDI|nr:unnamed protein product [Oikopleura dioica]
MRFLLIIFINLAQASLRQRDSCNRIFLIARFWNIFVIREMRFLLIILINLAQASLRQRETCNGTEIGNGGTNWYRLRPAQEHLRLFELN